MTLTSFEPISTPQASVLILGSMPSVKSLESQQYYGHPRNAFWKIMQSITAVPFNASDQARCDGIKSNGIAVWDVIAQCKRQGSLDADIVAGTIQPNSILTFLTNHPKIKLIGLNGGTAFKLFKKYFLTDIPKHIHVMQLPSTSPAYTLPFQKKLDHWLTHLIPTS